MRRNRTYSSKLPVDHIPEAMKAAFDEYLETILVYGDSQLFHQFSDMPRTDKIKCPQCSHLGATVVKREQDGGGPGPFTITTYRCKRCKFSGPDAYTDKLWRAVTFKEWLSMEGS